jgi:hypothetical protein
MGEREALALLRIGGVRRIAAADREKDSDNDLSQSTIGHSGHLPGERNDGQWLAIPTGRLVDAAQCSPAASVPRRNESLNGIERDQGIARPQAELSLDINSKGTADVRT